MRFSVSHIGSYADGRFDRGKVSFTSGGNAGTRPVPIWAWDETGTGTADITLFMPLVEAPLVGDALNVKDGCDRTARGPNGCMTHGQILFFRGFDDVPGTKALKPAIPSSAAGSSGKGK
jgi:hypothetical protein